MLLANVPVGMKMRRVANRGEEVFVPFANFHRAFLFGGYGFEKGSDSALSKSFMNSF